MQNRKKLCVALCILLLGICACHTGNNEKKSPAKPTGGENSVTDAPKKTTEEKTVTGTPTPTPAPIWVDNVKLRINELMASNESCPIDGKTKDWVELYNFGNEPLKIGELWISDDEENLCKCRLPEKTLPAGEYMVLTAGKEDCDISFALSKEGETLWIANDEGNIVDSLSYGKIKKDVSFCRDFGYVGSATPGRENRISTADSALAKEKLQFLKLDILSVTIDEKDFETLRQNNTQTVTYPIHLTYYAQTKDGPVRAFAYTAGMEIYGNTSRKYERCSFQIKFKKEFGQNRLYYKLFDDRECEEFSSFTLRGGSQDAFMTMLRDEFIASLWHNYFGDDSTLMTESFTPVNLYLNGSYYGIYYIREHLDEDTLAADYGCDPEEVGLVTRYHSVKQGNKSDTNELIQVWETAGGADYTNEEEYEALERVLDLDSLIDFYLLNIWAENRDLIVKNVKIRDGKWFYALHDLDLSFRDGKENATMQFLGRENAGISTMNTIIYRLLKREDFLQRFEKRKEELLNTVFEPEYVTSQLDLLVERLQHDMQSSCEVWDGVLDETEHIYYVSYGRWIQKTDELRHRLENRKEAMEEEWNELMSGK